MMQLDETHQPTRKSWIDSANRPEQDFPIQNLPYGVFSTPDKPKPRVGVAIGDFILCLASIARAGLLEVSGDIFDQPGLNQFMKLGPEHWTRTRKTLSSLLEKDNQSLRDQGNLCARCLIPQQEAILHLPFKVEGYTDFYASREHATNVGSMFRGPDNALMPNWLHLPVGYNGRASTVVVSGTDIHRPWGQIKTPDSEAPVFAPSRKLDFELEMGAVIGTSSNLGAQISVAEADRMVFGFVLLNDWSARDIQVWEYQPLGPFQAKAFATTLSPWVVTQAALAPFRLQGPKQDPSPLPYLQQEGKQNYDIQLRVTLQPQDDSAETCISQTNFKTMYWSSAQQLAHHASSGCKMCSGDLLGSGTISGPTQESYGSLLELTWNGRDPLTLKGGQTRCFIEDGDQITLHGWCQNESYRIGFGQASGRILPALNREKLA